jgi:hypothetical protein
MSLINGITVTLYERTQTGVDGFNNPVYAETAVDVDNVLVYPTEDRDIVDAMQLYGKKAVYEICIPKGDEQEWEDCRVDFFGNSFRVFGTGKEYIEANVPLEWNKKYMVERYE